MRSILLSIKKRSVRITMWLGAMLGITACIGSESCNLQPNMYGPPPTNDSIEVIEDVYGPPIEDINTADNPSEPLQNENDTTAN